MEWIKRLNDTIDYIEAHLVEEPDYNKLSQIAGCSVYHYQRMFAYIAGVTLSEYIRRRRMSLAAVDLLAGEKVINVALKYGYQSPTAFTRAFQTIHGITPSAVKMAGVTVKSFPPLRFHIMVKGAAEMNYRIEKKDAFRIIGKSWPLTQDMEQNFATVPLMWQEAGMSGLIPRLVEMIRKEPLGILGFCGGTTDENWRYWIAVSSDAPAVDGLEETIVPAFTWAIFTGEGECPQAIQELEQRIVTEWLPTSGYEYDNGPDIEVYLEPNPQNSRFEVWIPVVKPNK